MTTRAPNPRWRSSRRSSRWRQPVCNPHCPSREPGDAAEAGGALAPAEAGRMKIAMLAPIAWRTPPRHYGPWEQVTSLITEGLVRLGIDVTLFATGDSVTAAE